MAVGAFGTLPGDQFCPLACFCKRQPVVEDTKGTPTRLVDGARRSILPRVVQNGMGVCVEAKLSEIQLESE